MAPGGPQLHPGGGERGLEERAPAPAQHCRHLEAPEEEGEAPAPTAAEVSAKQGPGARELVREHRRPEAWRGQLQHHHHLHLQRRHGDVRHGPVALTPPVPYPWSSPGLNLHPCPSIPDRAPALCPDLTSPLDLECSSDTSHTVNPVDSYASPPSHRNKKITDKEGKKETRLVLLSGVGCPAPCQVLIG